jgi:HSP20 family protein
MADKQEDVKEKINKQTLKAKKQAEDLKNKTADITKETKDKAIEVKKGALSKTADAKDKALMKTEEIKEDAKTKTSTMKEDTSEKSDELKDNADKTRKQAERKINEFISTLKDKQGELGKTIADYTSGEKPLTDLIDSGESFIIKSDLPKIKKEDITVHITEDSVELTVLFDDADENIEFLKKERNYGETTRTIKLPDLIEVKKASAKFEDSVLTLNLPKVQEEKIKVEIK